jgi:membrane-associated protease RseP (regulator of RpoE activity)
VPPPHPDPGVPAPQDRPWPPPYAWELPPQPVPQPSAWRSWGINLLLFVVTAISVYFAGGVRLACGLLAILFAHEMGHYLACRFYQVDATLPFFIPGLWLPMGLNFSPVPVPFVGTFGAVIRIRARIPHRTALFDIGIAGPLAGFLVCLPVLALGILEAQIVPTPSAGDPRFFLEFGEPLLLQWAVIALRGAIPEGHTLLIGPLGEAAWFGLFVTALNLIPIGQLDGGHVTYALMRHWAATISKVGQWVCLLLVYFGPSWLFWSLLLRVLGRRHPPTLDDEQPLGRGRVAVGILGLLVFVVCFVPDPIVFSWREFFGALGLFGASETAPPLT